MKRTLVALAAAMLGAGAWAGAVSNTTNDVTLRLTGFAYGSASADLTLDSNGVIGVGELKGEITRNGVTTSFLTYCTDIYQSVGFNTTYTYTQVANGASPGFSTGQADLLGKLYTLAGRDVDTTDESVAFQLAVWEIVNESNSGLNVQSGLFKLVAGAGSVSNAQITLANNWLTAVSDVNAVKSFNAERLYSSVTQDFVVFTQVPNVSIQNVPEPASFGLVGLALLGLWGTRQARRR